MKPTITIITPIFNSGFKARKIISQVLAQDITDFEFIIVDDGSTDDSIKHLEPFAKQDRRIKIIKQPNGGPSGARNTGIKDARGKFIIFLDSDDAIDPTMISKMLKKITTTNSDIVTCGIKYITFKNGQQASSVHIGVAPIPKQQKNEPLATYIIKLLGIDGRLYNPCNKIYRTSLIKKHHIQFKEGLDFGEDLTFNLHYLKHCKKITFIHEPLYIYNFDTSSGTFGKSSLIYKNRQTNFQELLKFAGNNLDQKTLDLLSWVKFYWLCSFGLAVSSSNLKFKAKLKKIKSAKESDKFPLAKNRRNIGTKKYLIELMLTVCKITTFGLFIFVATLNFFKNNHHSARLWRRLQVGSTTK